MSICGVGALCTAFIASWSNGSEDAMIPPIERNLSRAAVLLPASDLRLKSLRLNTFCSIDYTLIRISHRHQRFDNPEDPAPYL